MITVIHISKSPFLNAVTQKIEMQQDMKLLGQIYSENIEFAITAGMHPDVILIDLESMSVYESIELIKQIKASIQKAKIITLVKAKQKVMNELVLIEAGSDSIIETCPDFLEKIVQTIRQVLDFYFVMPHPLTEKLRAQLEIIKQDNYDLFHKRLAENNVNLSLKETRVAYYLKRNMRNRDIAAQLNLSEGTVKVHISKIYQKLNIKGRKNVVEYLNRIMSKRVLALQ